MDDASIPRGLSPNFPGQFSAFGFTMADARVDRHRTVQLNSRAFDAIRAKEALKKSQRAKVEQMEKKVHQQRRDTQARREEEWKQKQDRISTHRAGVREKRVLKARRAAEAQDEAKKHRERLHSMSAHL